MTNRKGSHWRVIALLMAVVAMGQFNRIAMPTAGTERIIPQLKLDENYSSIAEVQMGYVYSGFLLCYTLAMLPGGWFIDRYGARAALMILLFGSVVFVALTGGVGWLFHDAPSIWLGLMIVRCSMGIFNAPLHPAAARMVYDNVPDRLKTTANGLVTLSAALGIASTYYGLGVLMDRYDWPVAFYVTSGFTLAVAILWCWGTSGDRRTGEANRSILSTLHGMLRLFGNTSVLAITMSYAALGYFQYLFFYWIGYYFETIQHQSRDVSRQYSTLITLFMGAGMALGGWLADRVPANYPWRVRRGLVPALGMLASGVIFVLGLFSSDPEWTFRACAVSAACIGMCEGGFWTTVVELGENQGGTAAGFMNTGGNIGGTLSPLLTAQMSTFFATQYGESLGWKLSMAVAGVVPVLGALLWSGVNKPCESNPRASERTSG